MRRSICGIVLVGLMAVLSLSAGAQDAQPPQPPQPPPPPLASMTTSRALLLPAQEVTGVGETRAWLARFDSVLTARLENGGIGTGWAYPRDAMRYARQNPTYAADPRSMGAQPLKSEKVRNGFSLPEPFATRSRVLTAIGNARHVIVPVAATLDSTTTPRSAKLQVTVVDPKASRVVWTGVITASFDGGALAVADSLAAGAARLFIKEQ